MIVEKLPKRDVRLTFSNGRAVDIWTSTIGLNMLECDGFERGFMLGHDDSLTVREEPEMREYNDEPDWTPDERREFAEFMAERWREWAKR